MFCVIFSPAQGIPVQFKTLVIQDRFFERKPAKKTPKQNIDLYSNYVHIFEQKSCQIN